jgi:hypothetical protein
MQLCPKAVTRSSCLGRGAALGRTDIGFVAGRAKPTLVGLVGPENAGKTTLLAAWYLLIGRGVPISERHRFAGSFTLSGWEAVARSLQWAPGSPPEFPAHTSTRGGREQGLLHFAFREDDEQLRDYLFTDAPGLWFQKWAINEEAADAAGARWIFEHADLFLLMADCAALSGRDSKSVWHRSQQTRNGRHSNKSQQIYTRAGPDHNDLWRRSGGKNADLQHYGDGRARWSDAVFKSRRGYSLRVWTLLGKMKEEYYWNDDLNYLSSDPEFQERH